MLHCYNVSWTDMWRPCTIAIPIPFDGAISIRTIALGGTIGLQASDDFDRSSTVVAVPVGRRSNCRRCHDCSISRVQFSCCDFPSRIRFQFDGGGKEEEREEKTCDFWVRQSGASTRHRLRLRPGRHFETGPAKFRPYNVATRLKMKRQMACGQAWDLFADVDSGD